MRDLRNIVAGSLLAGLLTVTGTSTGARAAGAKLYVTDPGVHGVTHDELLRTGAIEGSVDSRRLSMTRGGEPVPIWVEDGGDGRFDPGDRIEFVAERLAGEVSYHNEYTRLNVYRLETGASPTAGAPSRMTALAAPAGCEDAAEQFVVKHLEQDKLRLRFPRLADTGTEVWYWKKLTQIDPEPFRQPLRLGDLDREAAHPVRLELHLRGWSSLPANLSESAPDHRVEVLIDGKPIGEGQWSNNQEGHRASIEIPARSFKAAEAELALRVVPRVLREGEPPEIDVVLLNWVRVEYPRRPVVNGPAVRFSVRAPGEPSCITLDADSDRPLVLYGSDGSRAVARSKGQTHLFKIDASTSYDAILAGSVRRPVAIERDQPSDLATRKRQADYLLITHPRLRQAVEPLATFHRERGLSVELVDIRDVYDEFNHGITHPRAIRDFIHHAWSSWTRPAPRFVLLVGDASWDARNVTADDQNYVDWTFNPRHETRFQKNRSTPYAERAGVNHRNLIPTWSYGTREGHAASDNWFVTLEGNDDQPELAIGRLPVTEPGEVTDIVNKTLAYASVEHRGDWQRRMLWITNDQPGFQRRSDLLVTKMDARGFVAHRVYPAQDEPSNAAHRARLHAEFNEGQFLVHFFGHGGRYIWRTGPPDLQKNHDLFTLDDLDVLEPSKKLPIVLSMTCYSAPFDHPNADSIGEKFLRVADRGAVAVIAAAWRNSPNQRISELLLDELTSPGTVGEAFMRAKQQSGHPDFLNQYNLLGDPALPVALPPLGVRVEWLEEDPPRLRAEIDSSGFEGEVLVEWLNKNGQALARDEQTLSGASFESVYSGPDGTRAELATARIHVRDRRTGDDGVAGIEVPAPAPATDSPTARRMK